MQSERMQSKSSIATSSEARRTKFPALASVGLRGCACRLSACSPHPVYLSSPKSTVQVGLSLGVVGGFGGVPAV